MLRVYARTREREKAWKFGALCTVGSLVAAPFVMMIFEPKGRWRFGEVRMAYFSEKVKGFLLIPLKHLDSVGLFNHSRVGLRSPAAAAPSPDDRPHRHRFVLSRHPRFLSSLLYPELDCPSHSRDSTRTQPPKLF